MTRDEIVKALIEHEAVCSAAAASDNLSVEAMNFAIGMSLAYKNCLFLFATV